MAFLKTESPAPLRVTRGILAPLNYPVFGALFAVLAPSPFTCSHCRADLRWGVSDGVIWLRGLGSALALDAAALFLLLNVLIAIRFSLRAAEHFDPRPWLLQEISHVGEGPSMDQGPVMVYLEFQVESAHAEEFEQAIRELEPIRRRDGAVMWSFFSDIADPKRYVEAYMVETWGEHVRQHYRGTASDSEAWQRVRAFHIGPEPPRVLHLIVPVMPNSSITTLRGAFESGRSPTDSFSEGSSGEQPYEARAPSAQPK
jgi:quinol monooxygenase YgiN